MPATTKTTEAFAPGTTEDQMRAAVALRLKAGAISSKYEGSEATGWTLSTEWNIIGEQ